MNDRRSFLTITALAATSISSGATATRSAEQQVEDLIANYGHPTSITRSHGKGESITFKVRVHSMDAFAETYTGVHRHPIKSIRAAGNRLSFTHRGVEFKIDHIA